LEQQQRQHQLPRLLLHLLPLALQLPPLMLLLLLLVVLLLLRALPRVLLLPCQLVVLLLLHLCVLPHQLLVLILVLASVAGLALQMAAEYAAGCCWHLLAGCQWQ
jgi:hypothetical protein